MKSTSRPWRFSIAEMLCLATLGGIAFCTMRLLVAYPAFLGVVVPVLLAVGLIAGIDRISRMTTSRARICLGLMVIPVGVIAAYAFSLLVIYLHHQ